MPGGPTDRRAQVSALRTAPGAPEPRPIGVRELTALLSLSMALAALGIDLLLPAFDEIRVDFGMAPGATAVTGLVTTYFLGLAIGQLCYGPVADRFGRRRALYLGYGIYGVGAVLSALSPNLALVLASRFVWGLGAAGPRVVTLAVVRDRFHGERMSRAMSSIMAVFILVPVLAPALGAGALVLVSWRWVLGACAVAALAMSIWARRLPETLRAEDRIERLRFGPVLRSGRVVMSHRRTVGYMLALTSLYGVFTSYLGSSENIIGETFGRAELFPLIFGVLAAVMGVAMLVNGRIVERMGVRRLAHTALVTYVALAGAYAAVAVLTGGRPPLAVFLVGTGAMLAAHSFLIPNFNAIAMQPMARVAGTASSVIGSIQIAGGALLGSVLDQSFDGTIRPLVFGFLGYGVLALVLVLYAERGELFGDRLGVSDGEPPEVVVAGTPRAPDPD
ncbi:MAG: multidrug effflux MFS transporter [Acidimicrobiia bacterium]